MPRKKTPCPKCGQPMSAGAKACRPCSAPYERTPERRAHMSSVTAGKPKPWLKGKKRPKTGKKIQAWWTPERREAKRQAMAQFHGTQPNRGLTKKSLALLAEKVGYCEQCGAHGSGLRLDVHHRNRNRRDNRLENLTVLCRQCHMQEHAKAGETGWDSYHQKRKTCRN